MIEPKFKKATAPQTLIGLGLRCVSIVQLPSQCKLLRLLSLVINNVYSFSKCVFQNFFSAIETTCIAFLRKYSKYLIIDQLCYVIHRTFELIKRNDPFLSKKAPLFKSKKKTFFGRPNWQKIKQMPRLYVKNVKISAIPSKPNL